MQLIPDQKSSKTTAILLLFIALILVYLLVFHWFILRHKEHASELRELRAQLVRFQNVAAEREPLQARLGQIRNTEQGADLFLTEPEFDEAAAALSSQLGQSVRTQADDSCQIVSRQPIRPRVQERFQKVTVNVRMRCTAEDFFRILHDMETGVPLMLVDELNVIRPRTRRRTSAGQPASAGLLDIRFNVSGYIK